MPGLTIEEAHEVADDLVAAFARLIPQLSRSSPPPDAAALRSLIDQPGTVVFIARVGLEIIGTLTLVMFSIPTGRRAWIEDVVVDEAARGHGAGEGLTRAALARAAEWGVRTVDLTSRPSRQAANRLYVRIGFELRETNLYRLTIEGA